MLSLRDFFHLPQVDPIIEQISHENGGLILVTGMDTREHIQTDDPARFLPSGRAGIFRILVRQILEANSQLQATIVAKNRDVFRVPRDLRQRVNFELVNATTGYNDLTSTIAQLRQGLLVVDQLTAKNAGAVLEAAQRGRWVISQMDTVFRGTEVTRVLYEWDIPRGRLSGLRWVIAVQRIPMLCECKRPMLPDTSLVEAILRRYPNLTVAPDFEYCMPGACETCEHSGRHKEITAFDFFHIDPDQPLTERSVLSLESYMLGLAEQGLIPLQDLLRIESDQLHRTYHLLISSEQALAEAKTTLERKIVELEAANRVLYNRTEELVSLQEIGQVLISTSTLRDLARHVCRQASSLCGADRAIFYFIQDDGHADVLAIHGWTPGSVPQRVEAQEVCSPTAEPAPSRFNQWPPGVKPRHPDVEGARLRAGLRVPLIAQGTPVGAMIVHSTTKVRFQQGAVTLLQTFANQAAIAIQRAGLIEKLRDKITQLEAAQDGLAQKERMEHELILAREVQQAVLPQTFPSIPGYHFAARNLPARQVGGDFYDVIDLGEGRFGLVIADVSDKGMPAAFYMALTRSLMVAEGRRGTSPVAVLQNVNELLLELGQARMFVTIFYGIVDGPARKLTYARAGHDYPLLIRGGYIQELKGEGVFLGFLSSEYLHLTEETIELNVADRLVLYTDGLIDTVNSAGERFGQERFHYLLKEVGQLPAQELCETVFNSLTQFQEAAEQYDDMTLLVVEVNSSLTHAANEVEILFPNSQGKLAGDKIRFAPIEERSALEIASWRYESPYDIYNIEGSAAAIQYVLDPQNNFYAMQDGSENLIGFCSFGQDGQVPGGDYTEAALDIGMGIHPKLTDQGLGSDIVVAVLDLAKKKFAPAALRVTIASFNLRAQRVWEKNGFEKAQTFVYTGNQREFIVMVNAIK